MFLLIAASGKIKNFDISSFIPDTTKVILFDGSKKIHNLIQEYTEKRLIPKLIYKPNYRRYGISGPKKRDEELVNNADMVVALWNGKSKKIKHIIDYARKEGKDIKIIII